MTNSSSWRMYGMNLQIPMFMVVVYWYWLTERSHMLQHDTPVCKCVRVTAEKFALCCELCRELWYRNYNKSLRSNWRSAVLIYCAMEARNYSSHYGVFACCHSSVTYNPMVGCTIYELWDKPGVFSVWWAFVCILGMVIGFPQNLTVASFGFNMNDEPLPSRIYMDCHKYKEDWQKHWWQDLWQSQYNAM